MRASSSTAATRCWRWTATSRAWARWPAIPAWKRLEKSPGYQRKKLFFKRLVGRELRLRPEVDVHSVKDGGWWFHPDALGEDSIAWSLGIGEDVDFDLALIRRFHLRVDAFDPTPSTVEWLAARVS